MWKTDEQFFKFMHLTKNTFTKVSEKLHQAAYFDKMTSHGLVPTSSSTAALAATLWYLDNLSSQREIAERFNISQEHLSKIVKIVVDLLRSMSDTAVCWPSIAEMPQVEAEFQSLANFPGVVGTVHGCHIPILAPEYCQADYLDRNHNHSVNLMAIFDSSK